MDMDYNGLSKIFLGTIFLHIIDDFLKWSNSIKPSKIWQRVKRKITAKDVFFIFQILSKLNWYIRTIFLNLPQSVIQKVDKP